jgi:O-methyltransferase involved in polyketide biosynthesis
MVGARDLDPADLESDAPAPRLAAAGMDAGQPAFLACLGVLIYLSEAAADAIFAMAANLPAGSEFVFTFSRPDGSTAGPPAPWGSETRTRSRRGGVVLVDEPIEQVPSANSVRADRDRDQGFGQR